MSKRIQELAEQATRHSPEGFYTYTQIDPEKFAESLIRECMDLASAEQKRYANITHRNMNECAVALGNFSLLMKDHFEDEE